MCLILFLTGDFAQTLIVGTLKICLGEAVLTSTHNLSKKDQSKTNRNTLVNTSFTTYKFGMRGYIFHVHVFQTYINVVSGSEYNVRRSRDRFW